MTSKLLNISSSIQPDCISYSSGGSACGASNVTAKHTHSDSQIAIKPTRRRYFYLDLIRALATLLIVLTHFNNPYLTNGGYLLSNFPLGVYIGDLGVSLFLIISGAALTISYPRPVNWKKFYWKRFKGIFPMFWIAYVIAFLTLFTFRGGYGPVNPPLKNMVFTIFGLDGLVANFNIKTGYILGEWFLGFIILFYLIYPALLYGSERFPIVTMILGVLVAAGTAVMMKQFPYIPPGVIITARLPELLFGIYFARYVKRIRWGWVIPLVGVITISTIMPRDFSNDAVYRVFSVALVGISVFTLCVVVGRYIAILPVKKVVGLIAKYSYPIFLVHHLVIDQFYYALSWQTFGVKQRIVMFLAICMVIFALAFALERITRVVVSFVQKSFAPEWWKLDDVKEQP